MLQLCMTAMESSRTCTCQLPTVSAWTEVWLGQTFDFWPKVKLDQYALNALYSDDDQYCTDKILFWAFIFLGQTAYDRCSEKCALPLKRYYDQTKQCYTSSKYIWWGDEESDLSISIFDNIWKSSMDPQYWESNWTGNSEEQVLQMMCSNQKISRITSLYMSFNI